MNTNIHIERATPEDALGIKQVNKDSWLVTYPNKKASISLEDIQDRLKDSLSEEKVNKKKEQIANATDNERYFVAKDAEKVVGYCHIKKYDDKNQLHAIYVHPEYVGKGIGTMFWKEILNFIDPTKPTIVELASYNSNAISFYKKLGFIETGKVFLDDKVKMKSGAIIPQTEMVRPANK